MGERQIITERQGDVAVVKLNRPRQANALSRELVAELREEFNLMEWDDSVSVIVLTGCGEKAFCAGIDLKERAALPKEENLLDRKKNIFPFLKKMGEYPKPIIGLINGPAIGGGAELALICDIRVASPNAQFGQGEIRWGMIPSCGAIQRLRLIAGMGVAKELILTGRIVEAKEALRLGIYNRVVEKEELMNEGLNLASEISKLSPVAVQQAKKALDIGADTYSSMAFDFEASTECFYSGDALSGPKKFK